MRKFKKKMNLICAMALICAGTACFSSCSTDLWTLDDVATTSATFYIFGYFNGIGEGVESSEVEFKTETLVNEWWDGLPFVQWWKSKFGGEETPEVEEGENTETDAPAQGETVTE